MSLSNVILAHLERGRVSHFVFRPDKTSVHFCRIHIGTACNLNVPFVLCALLSFVRVSSFSTPSADSVSHHHWSPVLITRSDSSSAISSPTIRRQRTIGPIWGNRQNCNCMKSRVTRHLRAPSHRCLLAHHPLPLQCSATAPPTAAHPSDILSSPLCPAPPRSR